MSCVISVVLPSLLHGRGVRTCTAIASGSVVMRLCIVIWVFVDPIAAWRRNCPGLMHIEPSCVVVGSPAGGPPPATLVGVTVAMMMITN